MLEQAVQSAQHQLYSDTEILVIEDGELQGEKINIGVKAATGDLIKILHDDDILPLTSISNLVSAMGDNDFIHANAKSFGAVNSEHIPSVTNPSLDQLLYHNYIHGGSTMYRKDLWERFGGYDESLWTGEEYDWHLKLLSNGARLGYCPKFVYNYRRHEGNKSLGNKAAEYQQQRKQVIDGIRLRYVGV